MYLYKYNNRLILNDIIIILILKNLISRIHKFVIIYYVYIYVVYNKPKYK